MKNLSLNTIFLAFVMSLSLSSCDVVGGIFKAGAWTAVIGVILVIAIIVWLIRKIL